MAASSVYLSAQQTIERASSASICHIVSGDLWAGAEAQVATLLRGLAALKQARLSVIVLNEGRLANELRSTSIDVLVLPESDLSFPSILRRALSFVRSRRVQLFHSHRYKENLLAHLLSIACPGSRLVRTLHGRPEQHARERSWTKNMVHFLDEWTGRSRSTTVIAVSELLAQELSSSGTQNVTTIPNGIDLSAVRSALSRESARKKLQIPDVPVVGMVGRLERVKRADILLEAAALLRAQGSRSHFVFAGEGSLRGELEARCRSLGIAQQVHFLGYRPDAYDVLRALDVLVLCSDHEGLPMTLLEAIWLGVPVVARAVGGVPEVLVGNHFGLLVESSAPQAFASACQRLLDDAHLGQAMCLSAQPWIRERFSAEANARLCMSVYLRALERR